MRKKEHTASVESVYEVLDQAEEDVAETEVQVRRPNAGPRERSAISARKSPTGRTAALTIPLVEISSDEEKAAVSVRIRRKAYKRKPEEEEEIQITSVKPAPVNRSVYLDQNGLNTFNSNLRGHAPSQEFSRGPMHTMISMLPSYFSSLTNRAVVANSESNAVDHFSEAERIVRENKTKALESLMEEKSAESSVSKNQIKDNQSQPTIPTSKIFKCAICLNEADDSIQLSSTICGHIFCHTCIEHSLGLNKKCPVCRKPLKAKNSIHKLFLS